MEMQRQNIPSLVMAVVRDGKITKAAGLANTRFQMPAKPDSIYKIASVSKQFITTGVMHRCTLSSEAQHKLIGMWDPRT
jgi:CubicO group peptidase (beta-lactamase class C family)